ncbi:MAG: Bug family tripartite tricarboxylate transporter substrate binding protein [Burkholderiales bacterium]
MRSLVGAIALLASTIGSALGQGSPEYPTRPVTIVSPTTTGTASDMTARTLAPRLQQKFGRPFIVENRTGASGNIGVSSVAKAMPDGHTILIAPSTIAIAPALSKDLGWDPKDLQPIARLAFLTLSMIVPATVAANTPNEVVALSKQRPGTMNYASPGNGTPHHLVAELFKQVTGADLTHVPYKGSAGAVTDILAGRVEVAFFPVHAVLPHVKAGKLRMLATISDKRTPWTPDVPTLREQGINGVDVDSWIGMFVPLGTPPAIANRLTQEVIALIEQTDVRDALFPQGIVTHPGSAEAMGTLLRDDLERYRKIVTAARIVLD